MQAIIQVHLLIKQYKKSREPAVRRLNFEVSEGSFFAFLGPNDTR